ncbi:MAG TPA: LLM class flavin-dependent oxidoreductase [Actinocrinis sp.]|nr:LLM class flavin-dependent oxidoreductase [Actinocrinis sp.]
MTTPPRIDPLSFLTPGNFADHDPHAGLEDTLRLFGYGERLGFDGAWIRQRRLERGVGSAAVSLAAAGRIELGTAVIPIGYESPFPLAEDLSLELPYEFHREDYEQILHDTAALIAPELDWRPAEASAAAPVPAA